LVAWGCGDCAWGHLRARRKRDTVSTRVFTTLDRDLTIRSIGPRAREVVGRSAFEFVLPSHHDLLEEVYRELFDRRRMVSYEVPVLELSGARPRWWIVRAAPLSVAGRVVAALAHAVPGDYVAPADWATAETDAWERELALRELMPLLQGLSAEQVSVLATRPSRPLPRRGAGRVSGAFRRGPLHLRLRPGRGR